MDTLAIINYIGPRFFKIDYESKEWAFYLTLKKPNQPFNKTRRKSAA
jgi:hypothetical protein